MLAEELVVDAYQCMVVDTVGDVVRLLRLKGEDDVAALACRLLVVPDEELLLLEAVLVLLQLQHLLQVLCRDHEGRVLGIEARSCERGAQAKVVLAQDIGQGLDGDLAAELLLLLVEPLAVRLLGDDQFVLEEFRGLSLYHNE